MTPEQRDELLIRLDERTERVTHALFGNGKPGLVHDVVVLKEDMRRRETEAAELRAEAPGRRSKALWNSGAITAVAVAILTAAKQVFGL